MAESEIINEQSFSAETDRIDDYQRLSRLAVWSVLLGLLSALSLVSPLLWCVPLIAVVFALGGLWQISRSSDVTGRRLALAGLGLAVLFGSWGMSWTIARGQIISGQARRHASTWLSLIQEQDYMQAHQLSMPYYERIAANASLEEYYAEREPVEVPPNPSGMPMPPSMVQTPRKQLDDYFDRGLPQMLAEAKGDFDFDYVKTLIVQRDGQSATNVVQVFRITLEPTRQPRELEVTIQLKRTIDMQKAYWEVSMLSDPASPG